MSDLTDADLADDASAGAQRLRRGMLEDELATRHRAYRVALERHIATVQAQLERVQACQHVPAGLPEVDPLPASYRRCKEARELAMAARQALLRHQAKHG